MAPNSIMNKKIDFDYIVGFLYFSISNLSRMIFQFLGIPRELMYGIYIIFLLIYFLKYISKIRIYDFIYYMIVIPVVAIGLSNYSSYIDSSSSVFATVILFLPSYLFFRFYDPKKLVDVFVHSQIFAMCYLLVYYVTDVRNAEHYSMDYGYWIAIPIVTFVYLFFQSKKRIYLISSIVATVTLTLAGNRGALLLAILCILYYYLSADTGPNKSTRWTLKILSIGMICIMLVVTSNMWLGFLAQHFGQSRTIQKMLDGDLLKSSTRDRLYAVEKVFLHDNKWGYGPLASRKLLYPHSYPHSLIYEMQLDFGVIIGGSIAIAILFMGVCNLIKYRDKEIRLVVGYIEIMGLGSLLVSSSYYYENYVPATIALFIMAQKLSSKRTREQDMMKTNSPQT
ncbi:hypothetical protein [Ruminococcus flavefaciens]|uniref:hypothetical protein n=1 Tax=Ruminococcus flavefaciens TaxID=1265 RepID=UPI0026EDA126|nr:hypothetical protein [Ruminococcus flavefaciens]